MKIFKISYLPIRVTIICLLIIVTILLASQYSRLEQLVKKMFTPSLSTVDRDWYLELDKDYILCGHLETQNRTYHSQKQLQEYLNAHPEYRLKNTLANSLIYFIKVDQYCPNCQSNYFFGISDSTVAVIRGTPLKPGPILETTGIQIDKLPKLELEDLRRGIPFESEREKLQIIEGLQGLSTN